MMIEDQDPVGFEEDDRQLLREAFAGSWKHKARTCYRKANKCQLVMGFALVFLVILTIALLSLLRAEKNHDESGSASTDLFGCQVKDGTPPWGKDDSKQQSWLVAMRQEIRTAFYPLIRSANGGAAYSYIQGGITDYWTGTDSEVVFHQEANFLYLTGVAEPDFEVIVDHTNEATILVAPRREKDFAIWNGIMETLDDIKAKYGVDRVIYKDQLYSFAQNISSSEPKATVFILPELTNWLNQTIWGGFEVDNSSLHRNLFDARRIKTSREIELLTWSAVVSSQAHVRVMQEVRASIREYNLASSFVDFCSDCDLGFQAYLPIVGTGQHSAILHWSENTGMLEDGQMLLIDAAGEFKGYCSDITRTYPVNGKYTPMQKTVYNMVLNAQTAVANISNPGVMWGTINNTTRDAILSELSKNNFVIGTMDDLRNASIQRLFMPHGVSHYLGLSVHDVDGYAANSTLQAGMVITIEPGIYFIPGLLDDAAIPDWKKKYVNRTTVQPYLDQHFGGVRIEDDYVITPTGPKQISTAPRTIDEVEATIAASPYNKNKKQSKPQAEETEAQERRMQRRWENAMALADLHRLPE